ncbi:MAG: nuclease-related domain-containing protein, partial [Cyanobacteria bacterium P01_H01_bin.121]
MAILINFAGRARQRMTHGERRFADRLRGLLEADYYCWYDVGIGAKDLHPDFIVLHPSRGLFVLEVKDWKLENLERITKDEVFLKSQQKSVCNPLRQARDYAFAIENLLSQDPGLVHQTGRYQGRLIFPYGYGVV